MSILDLLFCAIDDFWQAFAPQWEREQLPAGRRRRRRATALHPSKVMTIVVIFHQSHYRTFEAYYTEHVQTHWRAEFPHLVGYPRFVALLPGVLVPLTAYQHTRMGACAGVSFVDSSPLAVCHNARIIRA